MFQRSEDSGSEATVSVGAEEIASASADITTTAFFDAEARAGAPAATAAAALEEAAEASDPKHGVLARGISCEVRQKEQVLLGTFFGAKRLSARIPPALAACTRPERPAMPLPRSVPLAEMAPCAIASWYRPVRAQLGRAGTVL